MMKTALLFPGQGSQYVGMGKKLCQEFAIAGATFAEASDTLGFDLLELCTSGSMAELTRSENAQPLILVASVAAFRVYLEEMGLEPSYLAGHSLGELTALTCAGMVDFADALKIVRARGLAMQEACDDKLGGMALIMGLSPYQVESECRKLTASEQPVYISGYNSPIQVLVAGEQRALFALGKWALARGGQYVPFSMVAMKVNAPFHSPLMEKIAGKVHAELQRYKYHQARWPVIANLDARPYQSPGELIDKLTLQMTNPVQWQGTIDYLLEQGVEMALEVGPQKVLQNLLRENTPYIACYSLDNPTEYQTVQTIIREEVKRRPNFIDACILVAASTKNYNPDDGAYREGVVKPYQQLTQLADQHKPYQRELQRAEMETALGLLECILATKKLPAGQIAQQLTRLFSLTATEEVFRDYAVNSSRIVGEQ